MAPVTRAQAAASSPLFRISSSAEPPVYRFNLSLPPRERHSEICRDFKHQIQDLRSLYDEVMAEMMFPRLNKFLARLCLTRVYSEEETEEIRGIAQETGIPKHMVIAFNTFLDLISSCLSGGTKVVDSGPFGKSNGIVHFRNLDWGMDVLRRVTICIEYVRDGTVVARGVTYAGYVGVLTGVRQGLSLSLNYRPHLNSTVSKLRHRFHQAMLVLGSRPSMSSCLRNILLSPTRQPWTAESINVEVNKFPSSPCYLTFCTPETIIIHEKDLYTSTSRVSDTFLAVTNHDMRMENWTSKEWDTLYENQPHSIARELLEDSMQRHACVCNLWESRRNAGSSNAIRVKAVTEWLETEPLLNECTHYSCIMDPSVEGGGLLWAKYYQEPVDMNEAPRLSLDLSHSHSGLDSDWDL